MSSGMRNISESNSKNVQIVLDILLDETNGDTKAALSKMHQDYSMTWVYCTRKGILFPKTKISPEAEDKAKMDDAYLIKGRKYEVMNIAESDDLVMIELIESYPDPDTGAHYRTPLVLVLELENGKIKTGRHYCDPNLSYMHLTKGQTDKAYENPNPKFIIGE